MKGPSAPQSIEASKPRTPTASEGQRALIEHLAQAVVGSPQSPRRTASDTTRGAAVPLLYTELYKENGFGQAMAPVQVATKPVVRTNGSYKNRAASSPDLEPLEEIDSSLGLSSDSSVHELPPPMEVVSLNPSHSVISRKERITASNVGDSNGNGQATGARNEPFDPQRTYPSDACIFVANLLEGAPDEKLAEALTVVFGRYGTVFIKIKRKSTNMPYAFVQYTDSRDAHAAMKGARGARILDRVCRMEPAQSKRFWLVRRVDGKRSSVAEIRQALAGQGASNIQEAQSTILEALGIDHGIRVEFPQWDQSRDLRRTISSRFVAEPLDEFALTRRQQNNTAAQTRTGRKVNGDDSEAVDTKVGGDVKTSAEAPSRWSFMERYDRDRRSVFCGNLPSNTTESELRQVFERVGGHVKSVEVIQCPHSAYAFIEFSRADVYETAMDLLNGSDIRGMSMKVERKRARVPGSAPSPTPQQRFASQLHRPAGLVAKREPQTITPLASPLQGPHDAGASFQQMQNGSGRPSPDATVIGSPAPTVEAAAQDQSGGSLAQQQAQYINYLSCLLSAHQHVQALHAAKGLHAGHPANGQHGYGTLNGLQDIRAEAGSRSPEHPTPVMENGTVLGGGMGPGSPGMFNPFTVPYPLLSPDSGVFPNGVPFMGMPYGPQLSPTYPMTPAHILGMSNAVGSGLPGTRSPVNGVDHHLNSGQNGGPRVAPGQLFHGSNALNSAPGLTARSPMNGGDHHYPLGRPSTASPGPANGVASYAFAQGPIPRQNGVHHRVNASHAPGQGLNGGLNL